MAQTRKIKQQRVILNVNALGFQEEIHSYTLDGEWHVVPGTQMIHTYYQDPALPRFNVAPAMAIYFIVIERDITVRQLETERLQSPEKETSLKAASQH